MTHEETRALMQALARSDHRFLGIRPADATPAEAPCIVLDAAKGGASANTLGDALLLAANYWPACTKWALIASDNQLHLTQPDWPPRMHCLEMPATLTTFTTLGA